MFPDGRMVTAVVLSLSVPDVVAVEISPEAPPLADPTKWIGAWDLNSATMENTITGKPGGPMATTGTFAWGSSVGFAGTGGAGKAIPDYNGAISTVGGTSTDPIDTFTLSFFARIEVIVSNTGVNINIEQLTPILRLVGTGTKYITLYSAVTVYADWSIFDGQWHSYIFQYNAANGNYRFLVDGASIVSGVTDTGLSSGVADLVRFEAVDGGTNDPVLIDNISISREYLSMEAITALVSGGLPDSSGILS
jgi:hypothetical protein